jgi:protein-L-isoaspartate(D-aspartate) O-methyltransferase
VLEAGLALLVTRIGDVFSARALSRAWFIPCVGASDPARSLKTPTFEEAWSVRSAWLTETRAPDASAIAVYDGVWFSSAPA